MKGFPFLMKTCVTLRVEYVFIFIVSKVGQLLILLALLFSLFGSSFLFLYIHIFALHLLTMFGIISFYFMLFFFIYVLIIYFLGALHFVPFVLLFITSRRSNGMREEDSISFSVFYYFVNNLSYR